MGRKGRAETRSQRKAGRQRPWESWSLPGGEGCGIDERPPAQGLGDEARPLDVVVCDTA